MLEQELEELSAKSAVAEAQQKLIWEELLLQAAEAETLPAEAETQPGEGAEPTAAPESEPPGETEPAAETLGKKVYLTFDDGPGGNTDRILDVLKEYDVKATFFVTGKTGETAQAAYRRIVEEGHTLGMHSYSHIYDEVYASREAFEEDLLRLQDYLYEVTGVRSQYYRFPGGSSNTISKVNMQEFIACLQEHEIIYFDWNVSSGDGTSNMPQEEMMENIMRDMPSYENCVVLMHDDVNKNHTVDFLPSLIETLREQQCILLPINDKVQPVQHLRPEEEKLED